ncbi:MAG: hypothetical protein EHM41_20860 [Chloroflexi bacterium]|nr:MAG: hypothetical protein EHM41_20860 [Chloroflexota bacterium]
MDKRTHLLYNENIYQEALRRFGIPQENIRKLGGFESFLYEYEKEERPYILRISHSLHLPPNRTRGEMDFLLYLAEIGLSVPRPHPSRHGNLVEVIEVPANEVISETTYFSAATFDKAPGNHPAKEDWNPELFRAMGRYMGRLHCLSKKYNPSCPEFRRHEWYEDEEDYANLYLPSSEGIVRNKFKKLVTYLKSLPRSPENYGLIHVDFHGGNFFIDKSIKKGDPHITLFDWDNCTYAPFVYDIAMALFYAVPHHCDTPEDRENARVFYQSFMQGYDEQNVLDRKWLKEIPHFLKLREMDLYIIIHRSFELEQLGPWEAGYMEGRKARLENDIPYVDMDFS